MLGLEFGYLFQCKCKGDNAPKKHTGAGCSNGGMPWCPSTSEPQSDLVCQDGTPVFNNDIITYMNEWRTDCICPDGFAPRCRANGRLQTCPDGSDFDPAGKPWQNFVHNCNATAPLADKKWIWWINLDAGWNTFFRRQVTFHSKRTFRTSEYLWCRASIVCL